MEPSLLTSGALWGVDLQFRRIPGATKVAAVIIHVDGNPLEVDRDLTLAVAIMGAEQCAPFRSTAVSGAPRAPYCMMGACFECVVNIDGQQVQACMVPVRDGMRVNLVHGARRSREIA